MVKLILIRGLPGSGKSTKAKYYVAEQPNLTKHIEADMFFVGDDGHYRFDASQLQHAHSWCQDTTEKWLRSGINVVVSNTFVKQWEMKFYRQLALKYKAELVIETCREQYQNIHGVEDSVIKRMKRDWQE